MSHLRPRVFGAVLLALVVPRPARAFYELEGEKLSLDLSGSIRINDTAGRFLSIQGLPDSIDPGLNLVGAIARLMAVARTGEHLSLELHLYGLASGTTISPWLAALGGTADGFGSSEQGRFAGLRTRPYDRGGTLTELAIDRLNLRLTVPFLELTVGRQPINLATTSFFTPNDFWQAFDAQTFFRVYKPGVDALRAELELGAFTRVAIFGVLGYRRSGPSEVSDPVEWRESSLLARASTTLFDLEWTLLGGKVPERWVLGGALQGELVGGVGVRAEGHYAWPIDAERRGGAEVAIGLERRFESSLFLRAEYFFHGAGATGVAQYATRLSDPLFLAGPRYLGRHYAALAASYELSALLTGDLLLLWNASDGSMTGAAYLVRSLDDNVEASFVLSVPLGPGPSLVSLGSEQGAAPLTVGGELRTYF